MVSSTVVNDYFNWIYDMVCSERYHRSISYTKLLLLLHHIEFVPVMARDENRVEEGIDLRRRFFLDSGYDEDFEDYITTPCSVLEMMVHLSLKMEEIMDDAQIGDRTSQWFWGMISSMGLGDMMDDRYDEAYATDIIVRFIERDYEPNGKGGLFTIRRCNYDLRDVEIWVQLCWYLDSILGE